MKLMQYIVLLNLFVGAINLHAMNNKQHQPKLKFPTERVHRHLEKAKKSRQPHVSFEERYAEYLAMCITPTTASSTQKEESMQKGLDALPIPQELERETKVKFADEPEIRIVQHYPIELKKKLTDNQS